MKITHVAVSIAGTVYSLPAPNRHHNVLHYMKARGLREYGNEIQGFVDESGNFLDRLAAYELAVRTGQINRSKQPPNSYNGNNLYSEDLW